MTTATHLTATELAERLDLALYQFNYLLAKHGRHLPQPTRLGIMRVWRLEDVRHFEAFLAKLGKRRSQDNG